jgi:hypothetical protein
MKRRRLLILIGLTTAILAGSAATAHLDHEFSRGPLAGTATSSAGPARAHDAIVPISRQIRDLGVSQLRGPRSNSFPGGWRDSAAFLAAGLIVVALKRRSAFASSISHSSLWHATAPLGRGPPRLVAS